MDLTTHGALGFYVNRIYRLAVPSPSTDEQLQRQWVKVSNNTHWVWRYIMAVAMVLHGVFAAQLGKPDHRSRCVSESPVAAFGCLGDLDCWLTRACDFRPGQQEGTFSG